MRVGAAAGHERKGVDLPLAALGEVRERIDEHAVTIDEDCALHGGGGLVGERAGRARHRPDRDGVPVGEVRCGVVFQGDGESGAVAGGAERERGGVGGDRLPADELRHRHGQVIPRGGNACVGAPAQKRAEQYDGGSGQGGDEEERRQDNHDERRPPQALFLPARAGASDASAVSRHSRTPPLRTMPRQNKKPVATEIATG